MKKFLSVALAISLIAVLAIFTACSSDDDNGGIADVRPAPSELSGTITIAWWGDSAYDYALIDRFMELYENVTVDVVSIPPTDFDDIINVMVTGGENIDVMYARNATVFGNLISRNQAENLVPFIQRDNIDLTPYGAGVQAFMMDGDGNIFGLPYRSDLFILFYNRDLFDAAGVPYPTNDMTWADFRALAYQMTSGTGPDRIHGALFPPFGFSFEAPGIQEGQGDFGTMELENFREGWQTILDMMFEDHSAEDWGVLRSINATADNFFEGNAAMMICGTWFMYNIIRNVSLEREPLNYGTVRVPVSSAMQAAGRHGTNASFTPVVMLSRSENKEAAWALVRFISSEEGGQILAQHSLMPGYHSPAVFRYMEAVPGFNPSVTQSILASTGFPVVSGMTPGAAELFTMLRQHTEMLFTGNATVDETFTNLGRERAEILARHE